jgi:uncharacterized damage-inducible protein DinB
VPIPWIWASESLLLKCDELDAEQLARQSVPPSALSLLGPIGHLAEAERDWRNWIAAGEAKPSI